MVDVVRSREGELPLSVYFSASQYCPMFFSADEDDNALFLHIRRGNRPLGRRICMPHGGMFHMTFYELCDPQISDALDPWPVGNLYSRDRSNSNWKFRKACVTVT